jgi:hypothetical protein
MQHRISPTLHVRLRTCALAALVSESATQRDLLDTMTPRLCSRPCPICHRPTVAGKPGIETKGTGSRHAAMQRFAGGTVGGTVVEVHADAHHCHVEEKMQCSVNAVWKTTGRCLHKQCNAAALMPGGCLLLVTKDFHGFGEVLHTTAVPLHLGLGRKKKQTPRQTPSRQPSGSCI